MIGIEAPVRTSTGANEDEARNPPWRFGPGEPLF